MYVLQLPLVWTLRRISHLAGLQTVGASFYLLSLVVTLVVSLAIFAYVETPLRLWMKSAIMQRAAPFATADDRDRRAIIGAPAL
jgi:peptidoglycan/LPS O-acetylase OafA/YrhL